MLDRDGQRNHSGTGQRLLCEVGEGGRGPRSEPGSVDDKGNGPTRREPKTGPTQEDQ